MRFTFYQQAKINPVNIAPMAEKYEGALQFIRDSKAPYFEYVRTHNTRQKGRSTLEIAQQILEDTRNLLLEK